MLETAPCPLSPLSSLCPAEPPPQSLLLLCLGAKTCQLISWAAGVRLSLRGLQLLERLSWECNPAASTPLGLDPKSPGLHILTLFISHRPHHGTGDSSVILFYYVSLEGKDRHILGFASPEPGPSPEKVHGGIP